jgi:hypothetical protein
MIYFKLIHLTQTQSVWEEFNSGHCKDSLLDNTYLRLYRCDILFWVIVQFI